LRVTAGPAPAAPVDGRLAVDGWTVDLEPKTGTIYLHPGSTPDYQFYNELFAAIGIGRTLLGGGLVFHASSICVDGSAFLFAGLSGTGKSTLAKLIGAGRRISDDQSMVLPEGDGWWCRNEFLLEHEGAFPARVFLIEQAEATSLKALPLVQSLPLLMRHLVLWQGDAQIHSRVLDNLVRFLTDIPCFRLAVGLDDITLRHLFAEVT